MERFLVECNLQDKPNREAMRRSIGGFRVIRADGKIVSVGKAVRDIGESMRITNVYTREAYRGKGYARKVVNTIKNEILTAGKTAALNVDRRNPVTNHLYRALGFEPIFAQGEYRRVETKTDGGTTEEIIAMPERKSGAKKWKRFGDGKADGGDGRRKGRTRLLCRRVCP